MVENLKKQVCFNFFGTKEFRFTGTSMIFLLVVGGFGLSKYSVVGYDKFMDKLAHDSTGVWGSVNWFTYVFNFFFFVKKVLDKFLRRLLNSLYIKFFKLKIVFRTELNVFLSCTLESFNLSIIYIQHSANLSVSMQVLPTLLFIPRFTICAEVIVRASWPV